MLLLVQSLRVCLKDFFIALALFKGRPPWAAALQGKSHLCNPFLGIVQPQSQFPHSCVCERFIYSQDRSKYFPAAE